MKTMKVLIPYDATDCSREMLIDLKHAGLPDTIEAVVISFAEVWLTEPEEIVASRAVRLDSDGNVIESYSDGEFHEAMAIAAEGRQRVQEMFPGWIVRDEAHANAATWGTVEKAWQWNPDLVIVGSHGRSALGRIIHGSVGQKLLAEAPGSVRIARAPYGEQNGGLRIILAVDGSHESNAAIDAVIGRSWPAGTAIRVIAVYDQRAMDTGVGAVVSPLVYGEDDPDIVIVEENAAAALRRLKQAGLAARSIVTVGNPSSEILEQATRWGADAIFMGARGHGLVERALMGSVSNAVATRAHCSVEIVRVAG